MRKVALFIILILTNNVFAETIYCPQEISCDRKACTTLPRQFYVSSGNLKTNKIYYFQSANDAKRAGSQVKNVCDYGDLAISAKDVKADINHPGNQWRPTGGGKGVYVCYYNSNKCPFTIG